MVFKSWPLRSTLILAYNQFVYDLENIGAAPDLGGVDVLDNTPAETDDTTEEVPQGPEILEFNPLYAEINRLRMEQEMIEPTGYKGTDQVIIGKSGYLYENGYINEYLGYSKMYREVTRETIDDQVRKLEYIQEKLAERGTAFVLLITPSKASQYPDAIPDWYKAANTAPEDYVRPYTMLIERLADSTVSYVDCASLYKEIGLQDTFPKTASTGTSSRLSRRSEQFWPAMNSKPAGLSVSLRSKRLTSQRIRPDSVTPSRIYSAWFTACGPMQGKLSTIGTTGLKCMSKTKAPSV